MGIVSQLYEEVRGAETSPLVTSCEVLESQPRQDFSKIPASLTSLSSQIFPSDGGTVFVSWSCLYGGGGKGGEQHPPRAADDLQKPAEGVSLTKKQ